MIAFDFTYYKPETTDEAVNLYKDLRADNKEVHYYSGGTEFISRARMNEIKADAVIDLKGIPECNVFETNQNNIVIGSAVTLSAIAESAYFPLLSNVSRVIATHTERNKITIGGNISGHLFYREAIMPFLLADSEVVVAGEKGLRKVAINEIYQSGIQLQDEEFVVQIITDSKFTQFPHTNSKRTKQSNVNYPIVSLASLQVDDQIRVAFSGVCGYPFRLQEIEKELNDSPSDTEERIQNAMNHIPAPILDDMYASSDYRKFVLENALRELLVEKGVS